MIESMTGVFAPLVQVIKYEWRPSKLLCVISLSSLSVQVLRQMRSSMCVERCVCEVVICVLVPCMMWSSTGVKGVFFVLKFCMNYCVSRCVFGLCSRYFCTAACSCRRHMSKVLCATYTKYLSIGARIGVVKGACLFMPQSSHRFLTCAVTGVFCYSVVFRSSCPFYTCSHRFTIVLSNS
jgi:hypothetical protein